ncbi:orotate phosphoribosyltransferase [Candidatus Fermentibacteria bacterium]|nr:MAG: orotate phosphoribosyltransferase [Candidatus Fermentibacteria bacterium]
MSEKKVLDILQECDALLEGHFRYTSGRHGKLYFEKIKVAGRPDLVMELGRMTAEQMNDIAQSVDVVCAPAFGAIVFGFAAAFAMNKPFAFLQRDPEGKMGIRSGFMDLVKGARVLLVEDVVTTGGSVRESIQVLEELGAQVVMTGLLVDRTDGRLELPVPWRALLTVNAESWAPEDCPMCKEGLEIVKPGSSGKKN